MAAEAAAAQGKFWEMHESLLKHQSELADTDLTHLALRLGLELYRFHGIPNQMFTHVEFATTTRVVFKVE